MTEWTQTPSAERKVMSAASLHRRTRSRNASKGRSTTDAADRTQRATGLRGTLHTEDTDPKGPEAAVTKLETGMRGRTKWGRQVGFCSWSPVLMAGAEQGKGSFFQKKQADCVIGKLGALSTLESGDLRRSIWINLKETSGTFPGVC